MPTRLEVLLQRRKSAAAGPFHRHRKASASAGSKPAVTRAESGLARWESLGIIPESYIKSLTIRVSKQGGPSTVKGILGQLAAEIPPVAALFVLRYGKICDNAHLIIGIVGKTARSRS